MTDTEKIKLQLIEAYIKENSDLNYNDVRDFIYYNRVELLRILTLLEKI